MYYICIPFDNLDKIMAWSDLLLQANRIKKDLSLAPFTEMSCRGRFDDTALRVTCD